MTACAGGPEADPTASWSPNKLYAEAKDEFSAGAYEKAIKLYEKLEARASGTLLAQQAQIEKAYALYKSDEKAQAHVTLDRFIRLHPYSPAMDYAYYLKGMLDFNDNKGLFGNLTNQDLSERDQKAAKESYASFKQVVTQFPQSKYAADATERMNYIVNSLAAYEVHVARFYYAKGAYMAAVNRAQLAIADFRQVPAQEEALVLMIRSYDKLGLTDLKNDTERVLQKNFPDSPYLKADLSPKDLPWWKLW